MKELPDMTHKYVNDLMKHTRIDTMHTYSHMHLYVWMTVPMYECMEVYMGVNRQVGSSSLVDKGAEKHEV